MTGRVCHSSIFHERHGTTAGILLQNYWDGDVTFRRGNKLYFRGTRMVEEDGTGRGQRTSKGLNE